MNVDSRQTIIDIAIIACGDSSAAFDIAILNGLSITDDLITGQDISTPDIINSSVVNRLNNESSIPATGITTTAENALIEEGIEFWAIEYDFVVS